MDYEDSLQHCAMLRLAAGATSDEADIRRAYAQLGVSRRVAFRHASGRNSRQLKRELSIENALLSEREKGYSLVEAIAFLPPELADFYSALSAGASVREYAKAHHWRAKKARRVCRQLLTALGV